MDNTIHNGVLYNTSNMRRGFTGKGFDFPLPIGRGTAGYIFLICRAFS